jgi:transcriptional regulator with XRE-family HTH domain
MPGFAQRIRALRLKSGRSESELADALGVTRQAYADLERFDSEVDSVISIHQALNLARLLEPISRHCSGKARRPRRCRLPRFALR